MRGFYLLIGCLLFAGCATVKTPELTPFSRAVIYFFEPGQHRKDAAHALVWLNLEIGKPHSITIRAFDEKDRALSLDPKTLTWESSENIKVEPRVGRTTVKVTLLNTADGRIRVITGKHSGEIRVRSQ
jgi:hypothetical protein